MEESRQHTRQYVIHLIELLKKAYVVLQKKGPFRFLLTSVLFVSNTVVTWTKEYVFPLLPPVIVKYYFEFRSVVREDTSDANPAVPIWIDPDRIEYYHGSGPNAFGIVADGDWDTPTSRFEDHVKYRAVYDRYVEGMAWSETELYQQYKQRLERGEPYWRCTTQKELEAYFESIDELYEQIKERGYQSQRELLSESPKAVRRQNTDAPHPVLQEVGVNIYRDGTIAKKGAGFHRLSIAKVLEIDKIPVTVRVRHADWQAIRDEINHRDSPGQLSRKAREHIGHPDLDRIVPESWRKKEFA